MEQVGAEPYICRTAVTDPALELYTSALAFQPNPTTVRFARAVHIHRGDTVFDIGTGIGPLAIFAALAGAGRVIAVDPVAMHCELARRNVAKYDLAGTVCIYQSQYFDPIEQQPDLRETRADVIIADVSGIADPVARALGWYSDKVPTGGPDGTDVIIEVLKRAGGHLAHGGCLYFPVALDLSDSRKIFQCADRLFDTVENAMEREFINFPFTQREIHAMQDAYGGEKPEFLTIQEGRRPFWRGQICRAAQPVR